MRSASRRCARTSPSTVRRPSGQRERRDGFLFWRSRQRPSNQSQMMSTRRRYSAASGASTRTQAWSDLLPESISADTGSPLARTAANCCSFGTGVPLSSRSNSTRTWRNAVTSSFFAPPFVIGLIRTNSPSVVVKHFSMPPFAATRCFQSSRVIVTPRVGTISPASSSRAGAMATNSAGAKHASRSAANPSAMGAGNVTGESGGASRGGFGSRRGTELPDAGAGNGPLPPTGSRGV